MNLSLRQDQPINLSERLPVQEKADHVDAGADGGDEREGHGEDGSWVSCRVLEPLHFEGDVTDVRDLDDRIQRVLAAPIDHRKRERNLRAALARPVGQPERGEGID